jgi:hypothetical protein
LKAALRNNKQECLPKSSGVAVPASVTWKHTLAFSRRLRVRVLRIPSHPQSRGRAERRVPVAPLGLMRCGLPQFRVHQDFRRRQASARRSACGVFSVACTLPRRTLRSRIKVPRRWEGSLKRIGRTRFDLVVRHTVPGVFPSEGRSSPCQWQCWRRSVLPEDRRSSVNRVTPHLRRPPHPAPRT